MTSQPSIFPPIEPLVQAIAIVVMRKISKNRTEDDVTSSTNGETDTPAKVVNDDEDAGAESDHEDKDNNEEKDNDRESDASYSGETLKKTKSKKKSKKERKAGKKKTAEEEFEVWIRSEVRNGGIFKWATLSITTYIFVLQVEKIIDSKKIKGKLHYLIRWKGYNADNDTWEPEKTVSCPELITKYKEEVCKSQKM